MLYTQRCMVKTKKGDQKLVDTSVSVYIWLHLLLYVGIQGCVCDRHRCCVLGDRGCTAGSHRTPPPRPFPCCWGPHGQRDGPELPQ